MGSAIAFGDYHEGIRGLWIMEFSVSVSIWLTSEIHIYIYFFLFFFFLKVDLAALGGVELRALHLLGRCSIT
jgi:hypothetical protein